MKAPYTNSFSTDMVNRGSGQTNPLCEVLSSHRQAFRPSIIPAGIPFCQSFINWFVWYDPDSAPFVILDPDRLP